jgi:nucleotide-binding universal stress UspA family protein
VCGGGRLNLPFEMEETMSTMRRLLVAIDLSEPSKEVIDTAVRLATALDGSIELVHVREPFIYAMAGQYGPSLEQEEALVAWIDQTLAAASERLSQTRVPCVTTSLYGSPAREIVAHAEKVGADLIVVGTHGRGGLSHAVLGSVAERIVQKARRPVLTVPVTRS